MKLTKESIEELAKDIRKFAKKNGLGEDFGIFYNGKLLQKDYSKGWDKGRWKTIKDINPLDHCEYFPEKFILGMWYDGDFYEFINGYTRQSAYDDFLNLFKKYGLYFEHCDSTHLTAAIDNSDIEVEYTEYKKETIHYIYRQEDAPDDVIRAIMQFWHDASQLVGDIGSCVLGDYLEFVYKDQKYRMSNQSPWQGSISWEKPLPMIKNLLGAIGATNIYYNPGHLD